MSALRSVLALLAFALTLPAAAAVPDSLRVQGQLRGSSGLPVDGTFDLVVSLFASETGGTALYTSTHADVAVGPGGLFDVDLGAVAAVVQAASGTLWLQVAVDGEPPLPRSRLATSPFALVAARAETALGLSCSGCVPTGAVSFPYAGSATKGGPAADIACSGCVEPTDLATESVATAHLQGGAVTAAKVSFPWAASATAGGAATGLVCAGCVGSTDLAPNLLLTGNTTATGGLAACTAAGTCGLGLGDAGGLYRAADGWLHIATATGVRVRATSGSAYAPLEAGPTTIAGALDVTAAGLGLTDPAARVAHAGSGDLLRVSRARTLVTTEGVDTAANGGALANASFGVGATGASASTGVFRFEVQSAQPGTSRVLVIDSPVGSSADATLLEARGSGATRLAVKQGGKVGVGTASPTALLHVAGDARFDGPVRGLRVESAASAPSTCNEANAGALYFDSGASEFRGCDGSAWVALSGGGSGASAPKSCSLIKLSDPSAESGVYTINPTGSTGGAVQAYCDMTTNGGGWTLVAQRNQYGAFNSAWATAEMSLSELASHQPGTDLGSARMASLNVNAFMAATGEDVLRVEKIHAGAGASSLTFDWGQKQAGLVYNPSGTRMFWYTNRFWCTGDGSLCKNHGGLSNGWDISTSTGGNQWLTYYPGGFILDASPSGGVAYNQSGAAWIYLWARSSQITPTIYASCKAILDAGASVGDGPYQIDPTDGLSAPITVYCDMTGGGFTLVAQRNQYGGFDASWGVTAKNVSQLSSYQPSSDLGSARISSLDVNAFMTLTGATTLRVTKRHPSQVTSLDFDWGQRQAALHYTTGGSRMFWYGGRYWCTGDGGNCKDHGGLGNGWDISTSGGTNQWLTYYPGSFMHPAPDTGTVSYNQSGVAWIFLWGR